MNAHSPSSVFHTLSLVFGLLAIGILSGCGGKSSRGDFAPTSINGKTLTFTDPSLPGVTTAYTFTTTTYTATGGDSGTYTYTKTIGTTTQATLVITSSFLPAVTENLTFTSYGGGTYVDSLSQSSTFTIN